MKFINIFIASFTFFIVWLSNVFAVPAWKETVKINCHGLPWCADTKIEAPTPGYVWWNSNIWAEYILDIIHLMLQYVSVIAVIALMLSWVLYLFSAWEEEKTKKAKSWIMWSLIWVLVALSSNFLVSTIINFNFK
jgi:hypothetical protein